MLIYADIQFVQPSENNKCLSFADPFVICTVARLFHADRKLEKARTWFNRAVTLNPDFGDAWAYWYKLEQQHGTDDTRKQVVKRCCEVRLQIRMPSLLLLRRETKNRLPPLKF